MLARWSPLPPLTTVFFFFFYPKTGLQSPDAQAEDPSGATLGVGPDQRTQRGRRLKARLKKGAEPTPGFHQERGGGGKATASPVGEGALGLLFQLEDSH